jgi:vacuolar-type H+-ATPase subunit I/STV1
MSRKMKSTDHSVYQMLESERLRCQSVLEKVAKELESLPKGSLCQRRVVSNGKVYLYPCLKYRDKSEVKTIHIPREKADELQAQLERKKRLQAVVKETRLRLATLGSIIAHKPASSGEEGE